MIISYDSSDKIMIGQNSLCYKPLNYWSIQNFDPIFEIKINIMEDIFGWTWPNYLSF